MGVDIGGDFLDLASDVFVHLAHELFNGVQASIPRVIVLLIRGSHEHYHQVKSFQLVYVKTIEKVSHLIVLKNQITSVYEKVRFRLAHEVLVAARNDGD